MGAEWIAKIEQLLATGLGTQAQKDTVLGLAREMDANMPEDGKLQEIVRRLFEQSVEQMRYLMNPPADDHFLPRTMLRSDAEVAKDYGLTTGPAIARQQELIAAGRMKRIETCIEHLEAGWGRSALGFCCAKDEWSEAKRRARGGVR